MTTNPYVLWGAFNLFIIAMLLVDLVVFHRRPHAVKFKEALLWTFVWVGLAALFAVGVFHFRGRVAGTEFVAGYLIEESLSVDNLFVFLLIFRYFRVPAEFQHNVLFWGILGALVMRLGFILAGVSLLNRFHWLLYIFAGILIVSGARLWNDKDKEIEPEKNPITRLARRFVPMTDGFRGQSIFVNDGGRLLATPLFIVLISLETTDLVFAVDSIPAVLAITRDPFIVYSSNAFAVLGLRSLYFALSGVMQLFHRLHYGLSAILIFVGIKMLISNWWHIPTEWSLAVIAGLLLASVIASIVWPEKKPAVPSKS